MYLYNLSIISLTLFTYNLSIISLTLFTYNLSIISLTLFTYNLSIISFIAPTVELASFSASTHCLEGFALLCIITPKSIYSSITFYTRKQHTKGHKERVRDLFDTSILLKY